MYRASSGGSAVERGRLTGSPGAHVYREGNGVVVSASTVEMLTVGSRQVGVLYRRRGGASGCVGRRFETPGPASRPPLPKILSALATAGSSARVLSTSRRRRTYRGDLGRPALARRHRPSRARYGAGLPFFLARSSQSIVLTMNPHGCSRSSGRGGSVHPVRPG